MRPVPPPLDDASDAEPAPVIRLDAYSIENNLFAACAGVRVFVEGLDPLSSLNVCLDVLMSGCRETPRESGRVHDGLGPARGSRDRMPR